MTQITVVKTHSNVLKTQLETISYSTLKVEYVISAELMAPKVIEKIIVSKYTEDQLSWGTSFIDRFLNFISYIIISAVSYRKFKAFYFKATYCTLWFIAFKPMMLL